MSLREYLQLLRDGKWWIAGGLLLGTAVGLAISLWSTPSYTATSTLYLAAIEGGGEPGQAYQGSLLAEQKARSYAQLLISDRLLDDVSVAIEEPVAADSIAVQAVAGSPVLTVLASDPSPERARLLADVVTEKAAALVAELERPFDPKLSTVLTLRIVKPAAVPSSPTSPDTLTNTGLGAVIGLALGCAVAMVRRNLDRSVRTGDVLESLTDAPLLGNIPFDEPSRTRPVLLADQPRGQLAESIRQLRTNVHFTSSGGDRCRTLLVTSALSGEGRTSVACNLASAFGLEGHRVLLVDADLRRTRMAEYLGLEAGIGLTSVLVGGCKLEDAIQPWRDSLFDVLPSGPLPRNPSELLASRRTIDLLGDLERRYDVVLIDAPAVLPVTDAALLATQCHGTLLVVRHGRTADGQVTSAVAALNAVSARLLGSILTMAPRTSLPGPHSYYSPAEDPLGPTQLVTLPPAVIKIGPGVPFVAAEGGRTAPAVEKHPDPLTDALASEAGARRPSPVPYPRTRDDGSASATDPA